MIYQYSRSSTFSSTTHLFFGSLANHLLILKSTNRSKSKSKFIQLFVQSHSVNLRTKTRVLFFEEKWTLKVKAVS